MLFIGINKHTLLLKIIAALFHLFSSLEDYPFTDFQLQTQQLGLSYSVAIIYTTDTNTDPDWEVLSY